MAVKTKRELIESVKKIAVKTRQAIIEEVNKMSVKTKQELIDALDNIIGEATTDAALEILEDVSDTLDDLNVRASEDWKLKYLENDAAWRERYRSRFMNQGANNLPEATEFEASEKVSFDDLFETRE